MKLLTKELEKRFAKVGKQDIENPIVLAKFFHPFSNMYWYATEYNPEDRCFFGWVYSGPMSELGYFSLDEFEALSINTLPMERDLYFKETNLNEIKAEHTRQDKVGV